jgi:peptidoglycan/LPS O-acetylase OafA/YrhL
LSTNAVGFGCLLILSLESRWKFFNNKLLSFIGRNSYAIYLWHYAVNGYVRTFLPKSTSLGGFIIYIIIYLAGSIAVGVLMTKIIEVPFLKIRDRIYPSKSAKAITL